MLRPVRESVFVSRHRERWSRLEELLEAVERRGLRELSGDEVNELAHLYRASTSDLAVAQGRRYRQELQTMLNRLVGKAHALVYVAAVESGSDRLRQFFAYELPTELRRSWKIIGVCGIIAVIFGIVAYVSVNSDPHAIYALVPEGAVPAPIRKSLHDSNFAVRAAFAPAMSAVVITHNVQVAIGEFAGGITGGLLTLYLLAFNGLFLGAIAALFARAGFGWDFWATIAPHGAVELPSIIIAAAAGLIIGKALVMPGRLRRADALKAAARRAATLLIGVAVLLVWAGIFEGFVSPRRIAPELRLAIGAFNGLALAAFWLLAGRGRNSTVAPSP